MKIDSPRRLGSENLVSITIKVNFLGLINENHSIIRKHPSVAVRKNLFIVIEKNRFNEI